MAGEQTPFNHDLTAQQERLTFALHSANVGLWELDVRSQRAWWDTRCKELYGTQQDDVVPYSQVLTCVHPDDRQRVDEAVQWAVDPASDGQYDIQFRTVGAETGQVRWVQSRGKAYRSQDGAVDYLAGSVQELTGEVPTPPVPDTVLFHSLLDEAPVATCLFVGRQLRVEVANEPMLAIWGKGRTVFGKPLEEVLPELKGQPFLLILDEVCTTGRVYEDRGARTELNVDGVLGTYYFDFTYKPLRNAAGEVYAILDMAVDVTSQVLARQALEASEARLRSVIAASPAAIGLLIGPDHVLESPNQRFIDILGKGPGINGKPLREAMPELITENQPFLDILREVYTTGRSYQTFNSPIAIVRQGVMTHGYYNFSYTPLFDAEGNVWAILNIAIDVTDEVKARQELAESEDRFRNLSRDLAIEVQQRIEELEVANEELAASNEELAAANEELAAGNEELAAINEELAESNQLLARSNESLQQFAYIASHDLQEPLRKIQSFGQLLQEQYAQNLGEGVEHLQRMQAAALRMSTLIRDLLAFARLSSQPDTKDLVSLGQAVSFVLTDLEMMIQETGAQIRVDALPTVVGDSSQLGQLFQNLLSNALKFRQADLNPVILIHAYLITNHQLPSWIKPTRQASAYHRIDVADNGIGFEPQYTDRIFQVFQRLHGKNQYAGTGIGLAICEKVVSNHGGAITASSKPGQGATFSVYLPV